MGYSSAPGTLGREPDDSDGAIKPADTPPVTGLPDDVEALSGGRKVTKVTRDWTDPPAATLTMTPSVGGTTLKEALAELKRLPEWGTGGGDLSGAGGGEITLTTEDGKNYTAEIHGKFFMTLPTWSGYEKATTEQKAAWDDMIAKLRKHENEHVQIAYRNAQKLVKKMTNLAVEKAGQAVADAQQAGQDAQDDFDSAAKTDHGNNAFGAFPKVELDTSADPPPPPKKP